MIQKHGKNAWLLVLLVFLGAIIGSLAGDALGKVDVVKWVAAGPFFPFSFSFGLNFAKLAVDGALRINTMSVAGMISGIIIFIKI